MAERQSHSGFGPHYDFIGPIRSGQTMIENHVVQSIRFCFLRSGWKATPSGPNEPEEKNLQSV